MPATYNASFLKCLDLGSIMSVLQCQQPDDDDSNQLLLLLLLFLQQFHGHVWDYPGELVPEETFTHPPS